MISIPPPYNKISYIYREADIMAVWIGKEDARHVRYEQVYASLAFESFRKLPEPTTDTLMDVLSAPNHHYGQ